MASHATERASAFTLAADNIQARASFCRSAMTVTRERLVDIEVETTPHNSWPPDVLSALAELDDRSSLDTRGRFAWARRLLRSNVVHLDPRSDSDFALALAVTPHAWTTSTGTDGKPVLDTDEVPIVWLNADEHARLIRLLREAGVAPDSITALPSLHRD